MEKVCKVCGRSVPDECFGDHQKSIPLPKEKLIIVWAVGKLANNIPANKRFVLSVPENMASKLPPSVWMEPSNVLDYWEWQRRFPEIFHYEIIYNTGLTQNQLDNLTSMDEQEAEQQPQAKPEQLNLIGQLKLF